MLAAVVVSAPAPLPAGTRLCLWSLSTGELLQHSTDPPLRTRFGPQLPNVTGALLKPPLAGLCTWRPEMSAWQDRIVLAGDWTSPGCSIEERARILTDAGATAVIFMGTEGLPLDWDGSAYEGIRIPSVVIGASRYTRIAEAIDTSATDMSTFLSDARPAADIMIWLAPNDTPLMHEPSFLAFDRALQALFFLAAASNVALALYQLARFLMAAKRLAASSNKLQAGSAIKVICLELVSALAMIVFIIDGPGMEHTRPVVLPWLAHRLALAVQTEAHMLALLVSSTHLQRIRSRVQNTRPQRSVESSGENFRESINVSDEDTKCCQVASCYHGFVVGSILMLVVVDLFIAVCTGMYIVPDFFVTYIVATYIIFVNTFIGGWFIWQAHVISRMLKRVASSNHSNRRMTRLSRNTMRFGALTVFTAVRVHAAEHSTPSPSVV